MTPDLDAFQFGILRDLVALDTVNPPGNERAAAVRLADILGGMGFAARIRDLGPGRANLEASLSGADPGPGIVLCGHLDVVAADAPQWTGDPFALRREGDRFFGRGVADMKGAISAMVAAAKAFADAGGPSRGKLTLLFVADEEIGGIGARAYVDAGSRPDAVIIGEPTGMDVCVAHRGVKRYRLEILGRSGHASRPHEAVNPIAVAARFVALVEGQNARLAGMRSPPLPPPSIVVTMIQAGEQGNTVPGRCRLTVDRRTLPHEDRAALVREVDDLRRRLPPDEAERVGEPDIFVDMPAGAVLPGSALPEACRATLAGMGLSPAIRDFPAGCDQFAFARGGIDCLLVGPGSIAQAHGADECVEREQLLLAREFYLRFIRERLT